MKNAIKASEIRKVVGGIDLPVSRVEYTYDDPDGAANLTQVTTWDSTKGAYSNPLTAGNSLIVTTAYNQYGMPTLITDARGLKTQTTYGEVADDVSDLYPTQIKIAYQTAEVRTETREYDFETGLVTKVTDADNDVSTSTTYDALGRPTLVRAAEDEDEETRIAYEYSDVQRRVITRSDLVATGDGKLVSIQHYDQLGRIRLSRQLEDAASQNATDETTGIKVQTRYRFSGANAYVLVSNAYHAATSGAATAEQTMGWARSKSDNAGRTIEVQTFGGADLPAPWGSSNTSTGTVATTYDANFTTVSDQAQKQRRSMTDALGRLIRVDEPDLNGNLGSTTTPNQPTHYEYDVLGNLTKVTQSDGPITQQRDFVYSSLSRLTQATNPESGTIAYKYDESGNLVVKTDARGVSTHYAYDALNRLTRRWYNASALTSAATHNEPVLPSSIGATDEIKFHYDLQSLPGGTPFANGTAKGRLVAQTYGTGSTGDYFVYDKLGRPTLKYQRTGTINYEIHASYNRAGAVTLLTYPSGRTVANTFDAAGRLTTLAGNLGAGGAPHTYSTGIIYSPIGAMVKEQFGTNAAIYNKLFYNSRGQLAEIRTSTSYTGPTDVDANRGGLVNHYSNLCDGVCAGSSMTDNNGNLRKQKILIPGHDTREQRYDYDPLNRLSSVKEFIPTVSSNEQWKQEFDYDRWGNRTIETTTTDGINKKQ
ncbi:MAG TPA: hypothetical protein VFS77_10920, partial [Pyrinomonadaceae bacterium]|nr:hypothetical protein [Pyrinomonadaceae bacterium]